MTGLIVKAIAGFYYCSTGTGVYECRARGVFRNESISPLVGDRVEFTPEVGGKGLVTRLLPRRNAFSRPPIANLDRLFVVTSVKDPTPNPLVIDMLTVSCAAKQVEPVIVITKTDLGDPQELQHIYETAGFRVLPVSNAEDSSFGMVQRELRGHICAFCGNTGVGKSSLLNHLAPDLQLETAQISRKLGRGRHTTRHVELYYLEDLDAYVADTPGFGALAFTGQEFIRKEDLASCFREFAPYEGKCRFTGCSHTAEKGCAVLQARDEGSIPYSRWESYVSMYREAEKWKDWQLKKKEQP